MTPPAPLPFNPLVAVALAVSSGVALFLPPVLGFVWWRRTGAGWRYFGFGALVFFLAQVVCRLPWQLPLGLWLHGKLEGHPGLEALWVGFASLTAGLFEEVGRWLGYRRFLRDERSWRVGVMYGLGHGGCESMLLIGLSLVGSLVVYVMFTHGALPVPADKLEVVRAQLSSLTPGLALLGGFERVGAVLAHVGFSVLVLQVFTRGSARWLVLAIALHAALDFISVRMAKVWGPLAAEGFVALFAVASVVLVWRLRPRDAQSPTPAPPG